MLLLVEHFEETNNKILLESTTGAKRYLIEGPCVQTNVVNRNKRKYIKEVIYKEVQRYINEEVMKNKAVGQLNHPLKDPRTDYKEVSHKFETLTESGDNWIGKAIVAHTTPVGSIVAGLMDVGVQMGISTRAVGSTRLMEGVNVVQSDFYMLSAGDIVSDPSAPDAYLTNLMEGREWVFANGLLVERESEIKKQVNKLARNKQLTEENVTRLFGHILSTIKER